MIVEAKTLLSMTEFKGLTEDELKTKLDAVECMIRSYTHNKFQNTNIRFIASGNGNTINGASAYIKAGDTVEVSASAVNDGLYLVKSVGVESITIDGNLFPTDHNMVTKIEYPADVKAGVINLLKWEIANRSKVGIKSETLSRHSVTYYDQDTNNSVMGYPVSLLGFLKPYMKARF